MQKFSKEWWQTLKPHEIGNAVEGLVEAQLKEANRRVSLAWHRFPDAKAARNLIPNQPCDYLVISRGLPVLLEAKGVKHEYRLESKSFSQHPMMRKFALAGATSLVVIHHYLHNTWRIVMADEMDTGVPSWDLRAHPTYSSLQEALTAAGVIV